MFDNPTFSVRFLLLIGRVFVTNQPHQPKHGLEMEGSNLNNAGDGTRRRDSE